MEHLSPETVIRALRCVRDAEKGKGADGLPGALDSAMELTHAKRGFVVTAGREPKIMAARGGGKDLAAGDRFVARSLVAEAFKKSSLIRVDDPKRDKRFEDDPGLQAQSIWSVLVAPLQIRGEKNGVCILVDRDPGKRFGEDDEVLLRLFAPSLAVFLELALAKEHREDPGRGVKRLVGVSRAILDLHEVVKKVADSDFPALVTGETGTGKELVARAIHEESSRGHRRFGAVNVSELSKHLIDSELFGHMPGAFTDAKGRRHGIIKEHDGSTVLLDEIGELPPECQVKLLRFLQEGQVRPTGSDVAYDVDVRIVAATHRDLEALVKAGAFRGDLYFRLNVLKVETPPLRERPEDLPALVDHFLRIVADEAGKPVPVMSEAAMDAIRRHRFPGNVRELENAIRSAVVLGDDPIQPHDLVLGVRARKDALDAERIQAALDAAGGRVSKAVKLLGMHRSQWYKLKERRPDLFPPD
ncbi:MAG TPA: sigma-54-dependent Fis family transcriptional regulator [Planctomycetota bacterium]|nr:sigma-54-dependent Fis family transcriptional regulator [Planctomycetota bacterium]